MKRNQCIICFDRISKSADRISTSHETKLKKYIKHSGWYHIGCLKEYINFGDKDIIPKCPLCRDHLIIDIPGFNYKKLHDPIIRYNLVSEIAHIVVDEREQQSHLPITYNVVMNVPNILLPIQTAIRYGSSFYNCIYLYLLYTSIVAACIKFRDVNEARRETIKTWIFINRTIVLSMWLEMIYSILDYIIINAMYKYDDISIPDNSIEYELEYEFD
jgi:hypothetical protein